LGGPAEETYCYPNQINQRTINQLFPSENHNSDVMRLRHVMGLLHP